VRMMSLPFAGTVDHSDFAFDKSTNPQVARSDPIWDKRIIGIDELVRSGLDHDRNTAPLWFYYMLAIHVTLCSGLGSSLGLVAGKYSMYGWRSL